MNPCGKEEETKDNNDGSGLANTENMDFEDQVGKLWSLLANDVICGDNDSKQL